MKSELGGHHDPTILGVNTNHLKALVKKDFINFWRRKTFCCTILVLPPLMAYLAYVIFNAAVGTSSAEGSLFKNFVFTSTNQP